MTAGVKPSVRVLQVDHRDLDFSVRGGPPGGAFVARALSNEVSPNIGVGFAIPAEEALPVIESLRKGVRPERGYLGHRHPTPRVFICRRYGLRQRTRYAVTQSRVRTTYAAYAKPH